MLAPVRTPTRRATEHPLVLPAQTPRGGSGWRRARRIALAVALICIVPALVSFVKAIASLSNSSFGVRTVEWLRDNGARGLVNDVESLYYSLNAPATGGPSLHALPKQTGIAPLLGVVRRPPHHYFRPSRIQPVVHPALGGEGVWHATFSGGGSRPPVLITSFRPDPNYPQLVAGVAWIDHTRTSTWWYPGLTEPKVPLPSRGPMEVPVRLRSRLVATFNSAFKIKDSGGGVATGAHTYSPMQPGIATFVRYRDGHVNVLAWHSGATAGPDVVYARQNLPLIVNHHLPNPNLSDGPEWGSTLGNKIRVWRSAVGVDHRGNLIYAAANDQTVGSLAAIMIRAGADRAMELDINSYWTSFITYRYPGAHDPANLLADMDRPPVRYLTPDDRDFFAIYLR